MVQRVERLGAELQPVALREQREPLTHREVDVGLARTPHNPDARVAEGRRAAVVADDRERVREAAPVEVRVQVVADRTRRGELRVRAARRDLRPVGGDAVDVRRFGRRHRQALAGLNRRHRPELPAAQRLARKGLAVQAAPEGSITAIAFDVKPWYGTRSGMFATVSVAAPRPEPRRPPGR